MSSLIRVLDYDYKFSETSFEPFFAHRRRRLGPVNRLKKKLAGEIEAIIPNEIRGLPHVRFRVRIGVRFSVRFGAKGVQQVKF
jgi:hypothetical protein